MKAVYEVLEKYYYDDMYTEAYVAVWGEKGEYIDSFDAPTDITSIDELKEFVAKRYEYVMYKFDSINEWEINENI
jgi:hypothetical protein